MKNSSLNLEWRRTVHNFKYVVTNSKKYELYFDNTYNIENQFILLKTCLPCLILFLNYGGHFAGQKLRKNVFLSYDHDRCICHFSNQTLFPQNTSNTKNQRLLIIPRFIPIRFVRDFCLVFTNK